MSTLQDGYPLSEPTGSNPLSKSIGVSLVNKGKFLSKIATRRIIDRWVFGCLSQKINASFYQKHNKMGNCQVSLRMSVSKDKGKFLQKNATQWVIAMQVFGCESQKKNINFCKKSTTRRGIAKRVRQISAKKRHRWVTTRQILGC